MLSLKIPTTVYCRDIPNYTIRQVFFYFEKVQAAFFRQPALVLLNPFFRQIALVIAQIIFISAFAIQLDNLRG